MSFHKTLLAGLLITALAACGHGGKSTANTQSTSAMTNASANPAPMNAEMAPPGKPAAIPPMLQCGAVQPVWVNIRSHAYHLPSDPLYGRTKHGQYMCPSTAKAQGYHPAKARKAKGGSESSGGM